MSEKVKVLTEGTPNPNALKFVIDKEILKVGSISFQNKSKADSSPLARKLFEINSVEEVMVGKNFITVSKSENTTWDEIYNQVFSVIENFIASGERIVTNDNEKDINKGNEVITKILDILDSQIRPAVNSDGGDVIFDSYEEGILRLHLQGACSSCPSSVMTLKAGIEQLLKREIPELKEVISV